MQVTIFVKEEQLEELNTFLLSTLKYEHRIQYWLYEPSRRETPTVQVQLFYGDYVTLNDYVMQTTDHPYFPKESRTKES